MDDHDGNSPTEIVRVVRSILDAMSTIICSILKVQCRDASRLLGQNNVDVESCRHRSASLTGPITASKSFPTDVSEAAFLLRPNSRGKATHFRSLALFHGWSRERVRFEVGARNIRSPYFIKNVNAGSATVHEAPYSIAS